MKELKKRLERRFRRIERTVLPEIYKKGVLKGLQFAIHEIEDMLLEEVAK